MRPVRLELEGFTSFPRRVEVDFDGLELFAITGPTGAGKTSLLDAMLYALYGETPRIGSNEVLGLISQGSTVVKVCLTFQAGNKLYRISRTRKSGRSTATQPLLEEHLDGDWNSLSGSVREIDQRVQQIVGLDFEGFTRSVILPQGEFDEFLRGDSAKRTEILKDLLNLRLYERMMQLANLRASSLKALADADEKNLKENFAHATEENLADQQKQLADLESKSQEYKTERERLERLRKEAEELDRARNEERKEHDALAQAEGNLAKAKADGADAAKLLEECEWKLAEIDAKLDKTGYDEASWTQLTQATPLAQLIARFRHKHKEKEAALPSLEQEAKQAQESATRLAPATAERDQFRTTHGSADLLGKSLDELREAKSEFEKFPQQVEASVKQAESDYERLYRMHAAQEIRRVLKPGEPCPVCEQVVKKLPGKPPASSLDEAKRKLDEWRQIQSRWQQANNRIELARKQAKDASIQELETLVAQARRLDEDAAQAAKERDRLAPAEARLADAKATLDEMVKEIQKTEESLQKANTGLQNFTLRPLWELEKELTEQNQAKESHQALTLQREVLLKSKEKAAKNFQDSEIRQKTLENEIKDSQSDIDGAADKAKRIAAILTQQAPELPQGREAKVLGERIEGIGKRLADTQVDIGRTQNECARIERDIKTAEDLRSSIKQEREEASLCQHLGQLLSAKGFIAYVQREVFQNLAAAASMRLNTLSTGRYTLTLSEDRNEFFVVDGWNASEPRSVKTLSGGESFLASLALALALAEGLAGFSDERARSRLDSLFIDEGISSLDAEALETAIEALETLSSGNRMVGVISHIAELGERLPGRIRVEKARGGSQVVVESPGHSHSMVAGGL
ncbi:MAG: SMC family ATPase [Acidobacteria bacterium]|nr:SMC family ATPase [Acidobacteriota bacterium]